MRLITRVHHRPLAILIRWRTLEGKLGKLRRSVGWKTIGQSGQEERRKRVSEKDDSSRSTCAGLTENGLGTHLPAMLRSRPCLGFFRRLPLVVPLSGRSGPPSFVLEVLVETAI